MGFSWITSWSKQSQQAQDNFKKFKIETIIKIPEHIGFDKVDVWFQDEARFGPLSVFGLSEELDQER
ncbi:hypothetical protein CTM97_15570 [Photobacterium phosphoreum]|uniref:Uncharacterized protein n=2 Tax=Photobacterium phosphoreum TaxID=659 RepID=A0A2T3JA31_PHOPO|nr:hypothetical protein CTM96_17495 [Photobacterium phosphoreum]PSU40756.1 hypothetical protein CTM97_15570 [Photobacterium phosphoreum]PSU45702.1 hypothetical protein C9J18_21615 [Photobacterium phosphoreum]